MTITQLEYILAVDKHGSFITAAEHCNVTQPTLSMQVQKVEDEFGFKIFERNHHPVQATEIGREVIEQAKKILFETNKMYEIVDTKSGNWKGKLHVGILPTLAPYLLPKMIGDFVKKFPEVELQVYEITTANIMKLLKEERLDFGILSTPLHDKDLKETPIFYEQFVAFFSDAHTLLQKKQVMTTELNTSELWTLNDEHCVHFQTINLCDGNEATKAKTKIPFQYQTGTIQSLVKMVEKNGGCTVLPELCIEDFYEHQLENVRYFEKPEPVREVSLVTNRYFTKQKIANQFVSLMCEHLPKEMLAKKKNILGIK